MTAGIDTGPMQSWVAVCGWNGRTAFRCGTFWTPPGAIEEARREAEKMAKDWLVSILPVEVPPPDHIRLVPGIIMIWSEDCHAIS